MSIRRLTLASESATRRLGEQLAAAARSGDVIALVGELGAGKTTLTQGLARGLGVEGPVPSPTFVLIREYDARLHLAHVDAYRLDGEADAWAIGLGELLPQPGLTVVEWADRIAELLPAETLYLRFEMDGEQRQVTLEASDLPRWLSARPAEDES